MGKGSKLLRELVTAEPLTSKEEYGPRPKLRLRPELLTRALDPATPVKDSVVRHPRESRTDLARDGSAGSANPLWERIGALGRRVGVCRR